MNRRVRFNTLLGNSLLLTWVLGLGVTSLPAADTKEEILRAAQALAEKPNYSWKTVVQVPEDSPFRQGPAKGKVAKGGPMIISSMAYQGRPRLTVKQGDRIALSDRDGLWESIEEVEAASGGFARYRARMARAWQSPTEEVPSLLQDLEELRKVGSVYVGKMSEEAAIARMGFQANRPSEESRGPEIRLAKGAVKFWIQDGLLQKTEILINGTVEFNGNPRQIVRRTITEISDIGTTEIRLPSGAKAKLE